MPFCEIIIIISIGLGAALPVIERVAALFVCSNREMQLETETSSYMPGGQQPALTGCAWMIEPATRNLFNLKVMLVAGLIHSLILFVVLVVVLQVG